MIDFIEMIPSKILTIITAGSATVAVTSEDKFIKYTAFAVTCIAGITTILLNFYKYKKLKNGNKEFE